MKNLGNDRARAAIRGRLAALDRSSTPSWGRMNVAAMLAHCEAQLRMSLGEIETASRKTIYGKPLVKHLVIYLLPWPKGAPTAPELLVPEAAELEACRDDLIRAIDDFASRPPGPDAVHPLFGRLSERAWGRLAYRHLDHHLRQFGV